MRSALESRDRVDDVAAIDDNVTRI